MTAQTLWLTTDRFESTTPGEEFINSRCFGEDFAEWLRACLLERNYEVSEPVKEDFGWVLLVVLAERTFTISIGITDESIGKVPATWCVAVGYEKSLNSIWGWFKAAPTDWLHVLFNEVRATFDSERDVRVSEEEPQA